MPNVQFDLVPSAADKFGEYTSSHIGIPMAIVLDGNVMSAPTIRARITDSGVIEGNYSVEEAEDLALILSAGALPATMVYLEERTVGPSLGHDSVVRGVRAAVAGLVAVMLFMLVYYKLLGAQRQCRADDQPRSSSWAPWPTSAPPSPCPASPA